MPNKEFKLDLGRKPTLDEVKVVCSSIAKAGDKALAKDIKDYESATTEEDKREVLIKLGMSFCLRNTGELMKKFVETGKLENPLEVKDSILSLDEEETKKWEQEGDEFVEQKIKEVFGEEREFDGVKDKGETEVKDFKLAHEQVEEAFHIIDTNYKKIALELVKKYGKNNTINLLTTYCECFLKMVGDWEQEDNEDEFTVKGAKEVSSEEALKDMRENGLGDLADALSKFVGENGNSQVKVFKVHKKDENDNKS